MKFLIIGDIVGRPGRHVLRDYLPSIIRDNDIEFVIANGENASGGNGLTYKNSQELLSYGIDILTMGNHVWDKREIFDYIDEEDRLVRPSNYPSPCPGKGYTIIDKKGINIAIMNLSGRVFLPPLDCPFGTFEKDYMQIKEKADIIILDFHAEATAEKVAMGWFTDGRASLVFGTHTHVQTADEKILTQGTGYITDIGMTGPSNSVLGVDKDIIIKKFMTQRPIRFELAEGPVQINAIIAEIDETNGKCTSIKRYYQLCTL
ncbi:TIGR00282 family metallophosphoesterase [Irregularibacter muris]|uniref:TIGR00282 family metallophosphoesterase n=1 Tax=Irregularibacter muris TaxID=1796619 RepID=A0AAE3HEM3_9FIRM|nr:TIGR00282 family metallophosphoesterase [Irregularibacter muris]MCR1898087.1 TIGR00282 family metallophosphoesterase [Irregularibacter muris]